ncbi:MAG TPA: methyltransferase domain-containing protein, partial [Planctomycetaceae bacterium]|nr:methyltransferase domain-containing protein [Planctomycetaceae bacterium]
LPDESCNVAWALESVGYAGDKSRFLDEAFRLLRPGGRIVVADAFLTQPRSSLSRDDLDIVAPFERGWALAPLASVGEFAGDLQQAGFVRVTPRDVTAHVIPSSKRMHRAGLLLLPFARLLRRLGLCTPMQLHACEAAHAQYAARRRGIGAYVIFSAQRPGRPASPQPGASLGPEAAAAQPF